MNKSFKSIFNQETNTWVAVSEITNAKGKRSTSKILTVAAAFLTIGLSGTAQADTAIADTYDTNIFNTTANLNAVAPYSATIGSNGLLGTDGMTYDILKGTYVPFGAGHDYIIPSGKSEFYIAGFNLLAPGTDSTNVNSGLQALTGSAQYGCDANQKYGYWTSVLGILNPTAYATASMPCTYQYGITTTARSATGQPILSMATIVTQTQSDGTIKTTSVPTVIQGVAAGEISATSTEAINGSQVFASTNAISALSSGLSGFSTVISAVSSGLSNTNTVVSAVSSGLSATNVAVSSISSGLSSTNAAVSSVSSGLSSTNVAVSSISSGLSATNAAVSSVSSGLSATNAAVSTGFSDTKIGRASCRERV